MYSFMNKVTISGIKNLKNEVTLDFYKTNMGRNIKLNKNNIKAIYGANGAGKSAIVHAFDIYEELVSKSGQLFSESFKQKLDELINQQTNVFTIKINFVIYNERNLIEGEYIHELVIARTQNDFLIHSETLSQVKSRNERVIIKVEKGEIKVNRLTNELKDAFFNQLRQRSVVDLYGDMVVDNKDIDDEDQDKLTPFLMFANDLYVETVDADNHFSFVSRVHHTKNEETWSKYIAEFYKWLKQSRQEPLSEYTYSISEDQKNEFQKYINNLTRFLKIFKPNLVKIDISHERQNGNRINIEPYFVYNDAKIHIEFESAGIKKLTKLYQLFCYKEAGKIIIIDEFDANLNDVYLIKLLQYFNESSIGQIIFITHNVSPMAVLAKNKNAIDFTTQDGKVTSWTKSGNYSPINIYQKGYISGLPFNIYETDFEDIFNN